MQLGGRRSSNIEDRRGGMGLVGGGLTGIIVLVLALFFGVDPGAIIDDTNTAVDAGNTTDDESKNFVSGVLAYTEDTWRDIFKVEGKTYVPPKLVLFSRTVQSACGFAQSAMGPFYCPEDQKIYLDTSFFADLRNRFGAEGDFAQAYVIAHEVGHHVQNLLGARLGGGNNAASVRTELQADCYAGVWTNRTQESARLNLREFLDRGDIEEALNAASAVGDDRIQMQTRGQVVPDSFTHGSAEQRAKWFRVGLGTGYIRDCDTKLEGR